ncbi:MAG: dihydroorotate dehydrogenase electron transfer subunit [Eubacteriales bacterium]|nr:dihydroorotate dehydrogenase electron transfer subunit [Eubacteriales bacterium]
MKDTLLIIRSNREIAPLTFEMKLSGDLSDITVPGQFVNFSVPGKTLRRPISVCNCDGESLRVIYKVVGEGTKIMSEMLPGQSIGTLTGLGNGYDTSLFGTRPLLIGGGAGVPPLFWLCKKLIAEGKDPVVILGFNTSEEIFLKEDFESLGCEVRLTTADGSSGVKGFVTDALPEGFTYTYSCGPLPMLKAVYDRCDVPGQFSFEERMGCGFGACMGCTVKTRNGYKRICKDGPVLYREEILWQN